MTNLTNSKNRWFLESLASPVPMVEKPWQGGPPQIISIFLLLIFYSDVVATSRNYSGKGVATYPNGDIYDGYFVVGCREGASGTYTYNSKVHADGETKDTYKGAWKNNMKHGIGR